MRSRLPLLAGLLVLVALVVGMVVVVVGSRDDGPTADDRAALAAAGSSPLRGVRSLAADRDRWGRLVAGGGAEVAQLLDDAQAELGRARDPAVMVEPVVAPFLAGDAIDDEVVLALARWTWPLLAADLSSPSAVDRAAAVMVRADDEREAVTGAVLLARLHRTLTGGADRTAVERWRTDLAGAAISRRSGGDDLEARAGALRSGDQQDQPAELLRSVLAAWGPEEPRGTTTDAARAAIAATEESGLTRAGSAITIASYLAVIDHTNDGDAGEIVARLASGDDPLTEDDASLVALEDALLNVEDPAFAPATESATLLRTA